jgi:hypothetical protein
VIDRIQITTLLSEISRTFSFRRSLTSRERFDFHFLSLFSYTVAFVIEEFDVVVGRAYKPTADVMYQVNHATYYLAPGFAEQFCFGSWELSGSRFASRKNADE